MILRQSIILKSKRTKFLFTLKKFKICFIRPNCQTKSELSSQGKINRSYFSKFMSGNISLWPESKPTKSSCIRVTDYGGRGNEMPTENRDFAAKLSLLMCVNICLHDFVE